MAKRKRLTPAQPDYLDANSPVLETKSAVFPTSRAPIAQVAGDSSATAALQELAGEMKRAKDEGRMIQALPLEQIEIGYLTRDRIKAGGEDLHELAMSIHARGQQTPIEVVDLGDNRYGLISGWRRFCALRDLHEAFGGDQFATVLAILRQPETASDAYVSMVEENEIRLGLSYYERARIAAKAVEQGVYINEKLALLTLYSTASRPKRSKIRTFLTLYHAADDVLQFAPAISERLGLALAKALDSDPSRRDSLRGTVTACGAAEAREEIACLESWLAELTKTQTLNSSSESNEPRKPKPQRGPVSGMEHSVKGIEVIYETGSVMLTGAKVTEAFRARLLDWLKTQA